MMNMIHDKADRTLLWESDIPKNAELGPIASQHRLRLLQDGWRGAIYRSIHIKLLTGLYVKPMKFRPGLNILELGCGEAIELFELAYMGGEGSGVDIRPDRAALVNNYAQSFGLKVKAYQSDACRLFFNTASFDVVMATSFFEHVYDQEAALNEAVRVLKPGGRLIIRDGNLLSPLYLFEVLIRRPIATQGKVGGLNWLRHRGKVLKTVPLANYSGRDEDWKTVFWWQNKLKNNDQLIIQTVSTSFTHLWIRWQPLSLALRPFFGGVYIVAIKR